MNGPRSSVWMCGLPMAKAPTPRVSIGVVRYSSPLQQGQGTTLTDWRWAIADLPYVVVPRVLVVWPKCGSRPSTWRMIGSGPIALQDNADSGLAAEVAIPICPTVAWRRRLRTRAIEKAALDRSLLQSHPP